MQISETALKQYQTVNYLMQGKSEEEKNMIKADLKKITNYGFALMEAATKKEDLSKVDASECADAMEAMNALAVDNNIAPIFNTDPDFFIAQSINFINAVIILSSARKQTEKQDSNEEK